MLLLSSRAQESAFECTRMVAGTGPTQGLHLKTLVPLLSVSPTVAHRGPLCPTTVSHCVPLSPTVPHSLPLWPTLSHSLPPYGALPVLCPLPSPASHCPPPPPSSWARRGFPSGPPNSRLVKRARAFAVTNNPSDQKSQTNRMTYEGPHEGRVGREAVAMGREPKKRSEIG